MLKETIYNESQKVKREIWLRLKRRASSILSWWAVTRPLRRRGVLFLNNYHPPPLTQKIHKITFYVIMLCMGPSWYLLRPIITKSQHPEWVTPKTKILSKSTVTSRPNPLPWHPRVWCHQKSLCLRQLWCPHHQKSPLWWKKVKVAPVDRAKKALQLWG